MHHRMHDFTNNPDEYQLDIEPDLHPGEHTGDVGLTALEVKELHDRLQGFSDADLKRIPVVPLGARLEDGSTYLDLAGAERRPFTARGSMVAELGHYYAPKRLVDYVLWNRLIGVDNPERVQQADEGRS